MKEYLIIGLDGGASKISGWTINRDPELGTFSTGHLHSSRKYADYPEFDPDFKAVDLGTQLQELKTGIKLSPAEKNQGIAYQKAIVDVLDDLLSRHKDQHIIIGIGMPGLKSPDKRAIHALANGPRIPALADYIEKELATKGIELLTPIARLGSDADYCGVGEEYAETGSFRSYENAYYLGGGTGVADAIKLHGTLHPFDQIKEWIAKTWEMSIQGNSLEKYISARGIQLIYAEKSQKEILFLEENKIYGPQILERALQGEKEAMQTLHLISDHLAALFYERIMTLYKGWSGHFSFVNPQRAALNTHHPFRGTLLQALIIGQRLGDLFSMSVETEFLFQPLLKKLGELIADSAEEELIEFYLEGKSFKPSLLRFSRLREAPAIGAGVDAWIHLQNQKA